MTIGIDWDEEEAAQKALTVEKKTVQESSGKGIPAVLKDTTPSSAGGLASVPPSVSTPVSTSTPMVNQAAQAGGSMLQSVIPFINPIHLKQGVSEYVDSSSLDPYATAAHVGADVLGGYLGLKTVQGIGSGISKKIGNVIGGVDPTIQAQINQSNKQAERASRAPQGKTPDPLPTAAGRIEPTLSIEPPPPPAPPTTPPPPVTPVEKAAADVANPMDEVKLREATAKADLAEFELNAARQATPDFEAKRLQAANAAQQSMSQVVPSTEGAPTFESRRQQALIAARQSMGELPPPVSVPPSSVEPGTAAQVKPEIIPEVKPEIVPEITGKTGVAKQPKIKGEVAPVIPQEILKTASGFDAFVGQGESKIRVPTTFASVKDVPKDYAFIPGMDIGGTNYAQQRLGQAGAIKASNTLGKPFGSYADTLEALKGIDQELVGPPATRAFRKSINAPLPPNTPRLAGKAAIVNGIAGTLLLVADAAHAGQDVAKGQLSKAAGKTLEVIHSSIPSLGYQLATFTNEAGAGEQEQIDYRKRLADAISTGAGNRGAAYDPRKFYKPMDIGIPPPNR